MDFRGRLGWLPSQGTSAPRRGQSTFQAGSSSSQRSAQPGPGGRARGDARAGLQLGLSDLKAQIPRGCGGKAVGLRHISHLGTWGNQSLCSEILQTFWKRLPSDLDVPCGSQRVAGAGPSPLAAEPGVADPRRPKTRAGGSDGLGQGRRGQLKEDFAREKDRCALVTLLGVRVP